MKYLLVLVTLLVSSVAYADEPIWPLSPVGENAYGPNVNSDGTGRAFEWRTDSGRRPLGPIRQDTYGPGIGMDATGAPVRAYDYFDSDDSDGSDDSGW